MVFRYPRNRSASATSIGTLCLWLLLALASVSANEHDHGSTLPRHPLEREALTEPGRVLAELPAAIAGAEETGDSEQVALLRLAESNACRVIARWNCQRMAAAAAGSAALAAGSPMLLARARILESRALMALQDFTRGEVLLAEALAQEAAIDSPELAADIDLAYSSLSYALGKHQLSLDYAEAGLTRLGSGEALGLQARLQRNLARAASRMDRFDEASDALTRGIENASALGDPKLSAELHLESARLAYERTDIAEQRRHAERVLELSGQLENSQLFGQAREVLGLAAAQASELEVAQNELEAAARSFKNLKLDRDELRSLQSLVAVLLDRSAGAAELGPPMRRLIALRAKVARDDRAQAADDFEAKLDYQRQQLEVVTLESEAMLARERANALVEQARIDRWFTLLTASLLIVLGAFYLNQLRSKRRIAQALRELRRSEMRAGELLNLSTGPVLVHDLGGTIDLLNPAAAGVLGIVPEHVRPGNLHECVTDASRDKLRSYLQALGEQGTAVTELDILAPSASAPADNRRRLRVEGRVASDEPGRPFAISTAVDITEESRESERLREQNLRDPLTGAFNRRRLQMLDEEQSAEQRWAVLNLDLDHFKRINDRLGHEEGDRVLRELADFLGARLRESDLLIRSGGDEFLIVMRQADESSLAALLHRLRSDRSIAPCAYSLGSALRTGNETLAETLARADSDMYERRRIERSSD